MLRVKYAMVGVVAATTLVSGGLVGVGTAGASTPSSAAKSVQPADSSDRALSAIKPGTKCKAKQKGKTLKTKYGKLKCTKTGKKYVWKKKVAPLGYSPWDFVKDAWEAYKFAAACKANIDKGYDCLDSEELRKLDEINKKLDDLSKQIAANQAATTAALNVLYATIAGVALQAEINLVADNMSYATTASLKTNEYVCGFNRVAKFLASQPVTQCQVTNAIGNKDATATTQYGSPTTLADLNQPDGLRERLFDATWKRTDWSDPVKIGRSLVERMAGANSNVGLLNAVFKSWKAKVAPVQGIPTGDPPVLVSPADERMMNTVVRQYINMETAYFSSMMMALQLDGSNKREGGNSVAAGLLKNMAENGINDVVRFSLNSQFTDYTFQNPPTQDKGLEHNQSWVIIGTGQVAQLKYYWEPTDRPGDIAPDIAKVSRVSGGIINGKAKMSTLQAAYPAALPQGQNAAWWSSMNAPMKRFRLRNCCSRGGTDFYSPTHAPKAGVWGDNVAVTLDQRCRFPVRMWDSRPDQTTSFNEDSHGFNRGVKDWNDSFFYALDKDDNSQSYTVVPDSGDAYNDLIRNNGNNGTVPVYDYWRWAPQAASGSGSLYRCGGVSSWPTVPASTMQIDYVEATGLLGKLSAPLEKFKSCKAMNRVFPYGLGKPGAKDKVHYAGGRKSTKFKRLTRIYKKNKKLDRDKDGIICEWTPRHKRGDRR